MSAAAAPLGDLLRPLSIGQILDRSIRLYRNNFATFTGIVAMMLVPVTLIQFVASLLYLPALMEMNTTSPSSPEYSFAPFLMSFGASMLYVLLYLVLVQGLAMPALTRAVADSYFGEKVGIFEAYGQITSVWLRVILAILLGVLIIIALSILSFTCIGAGILIYFGYVIYQLMIPILVLEKRDVGGALRRAWDLTRRRFWWVLGFMIILYIFAAVVINGPAAVVNFFATTLFADVLSVEDPTMALTLQTALQTLTSLLFSMIFLPLQMTAVILMYFDLRVRTEGLDLAVTATQGEAATPPVDEIMAQAPPPEQREIITGNEALYFLGIALVSIALCGVFYMLFFAVAMAMMSAVTGF